MDIGASLGAEEASVTIRHRAAPLVTRGVRRLRFRGDSPGMRRIASRVIAVALVYAAEARAQTGDPVADSASAARAAYRRAAQALKAGDLVGARAEAERAASAWPTQETYAWGRVVISARSNDTTAVVRGLNAYADLGLGRDVWNEPSLKSIASAPALAAAFARHDANRAPLVKSTIRAAFGDSAVWVEGMDHDARTGAYYVASLNRRNIIEVRADGATRDVLTRGTKGVAAIFGVRADAKSGDVFATTSGMAGEPDSATAALLRIRISDGAILKRWDLKPIPGGHVLGDLAIGPNGDVYVTDSSEPVLYRLVPGADSLVPMRHPLFRSLQGIAPTPDGRALYVADYSHGILRVDLASGKVSRVADAPGSVSLGCDGLAWHKGSIIAVQNGVAPARVMRFTLSDDGTRFTRAEVIDRNSAIADEPTIGAVVGDEFVYVANSQWEKRDPSGSLKAGVVPRRPVLLAVRLPP